MRRWVPAGASSWWAETWGEARAHRFTSFLLSDVWGGELVRDPRRRRVCGPRGVWALDRRRGSRKALNGRVNIRRGSGNSLKNNIAFHLSRKYIQTIASIIFSAPRRGAEKGNGMQENWPLFEKIKSTPTLMALTIFFLHTPSSTLVQRLELCPPHHLQTPGWFLFCVCFFSLN